MDREPFFTWLIKTEIQPGMVVVEIGSNDGVETKLIAKLLQGSGKIYSIEPDPKYAAQLRRMVVTKGYENLISIHDTVINKFSGTCNFYLRSSAHLNSLYKEGPQSVSKKMSCLTLDDFLPLGVVPNFVRMDIEGGEVGVLEAIYRMSVKRYFPIKILFEVHTKTYTGENAIAGILEKLTNIGFNFKFLVSAGNKLPKLFSEKGYNYDKKVQFPHVARGLFRNVNNRDAIFFISSVHREYSAKAKVWGTKIVRYALLERK